MADDAKITGVINIDPANPAATADSLWNAFFPIIFTATAKFSTERDRAEFLAAFAVNLVGAMAAELGGAAVADLLVSFTKATRALPEAGGRPH